MAFSLDIEDRFERTKVFYESLKSKEGSAYWDGQLYKHIELVSAEQISSTSSIATFSFTVDLSLCNRMNNLHGGCAATILDVLTTVAIAPLSRPGFWRYGGVSRTIDCTYLRPAPAGTRCTIVCKVLHAGKRMAQLRGEILGEKGELLCYCEHGKASIDPVEPNL